MEKANSEGVSYLVFPELSLTCYEPELAAKLAFTTDDDCFFLYKRRSFHFCFCISNRLKEFLLNLKRKVQNKLNTNYSDNDQGA